MWKVCIPKGRWMAGVNSFNTKYAAIRFIERWNEVEAKSGAFKITFVREDKTWSPST
jgi:hypothetical protein